MRQLFYQSIDSPTYHAIKKRNYEEWGKWNRRMLPNRASTGRQPQHGDGSAVLRWRFDEVPSIIVGIIKE